MHLAPIAPATEYGARQDRPSANAGGRPRVSATPAARRLLAQLQARYGALMFHQAGTRWEPDPPLCFVQGDFPLMEGDVLLGEIDGTPFHISRDCYRCYGQDRVRLDALPGRAGVFSLERLTGWRFTTVRDRRPGR